MALTTEERDRRFAKWLTTNGFELETMDTYVYVGADSFSIKDKLKAEGFKFCPELLWHTDNAAAAASRNCVPVHFSTVATAYSWGGASFNPNAKDIVKKLVDNNLPESDSEYIEPDDENKICADVECAEIADVNGVYGTSHRYTFISGKDKIIWYTTSDPHIEVGDFGVLIGNFKKHEEYRKEKRTVVSRVKFQR